MLNLFIIVFIVALVLWAVLVSISDKVWDTIENRIAKEQEDDIMKR
jgi:hypothetical protein